MFYLSIFILQASNAKMEWSDEIKQAKALLEANEFQVIFCPSIDIVGAFNHQVKQIAEMAEKIKTLEGKIQRSKKDSSDIFREWFSAKHSEYRGDPEVYETALTKNENVLKEMNTIVEDKLREIQDIKQSIREQQGNGVEVDGVCVECGRKGKYLKYPDDDDPDWICPDCED